MHLNIVVEECHGGSFFMPAVTKNWYYPGWIAILLSYQGECRVHDGHPWV